MGFIPPHDPAKAIEPNHKLDACRAFFNGRDISISGLFARKMICPNYGRFCRWIESTDVCEFTVAGKAWSIELDRPVIFIHGHSPFLDNSDYGSCNQYFWIELDIFDRMFVISFNGEDDDGSTLSTS